MIVLLTGSPALAYINHYYFASVIPDKATPDEIKNEIDLWGGEVLAIDQLKSLPDGQNFIKFQIDEDLVGSLFASLEEISHITIEKFKNTEPIPDGKSLFFLYIHSSKPSLTQALIFSSTPRQDKQDILKDIKINKVLTAKNPRPELFHFQIAGVNQELITLYLEKLKSQSILIIPGDKIDPQKSTVQLSLASSQAFTDTPSPTTTLANDVDMLVNIYSGGLFDDSDLDPFERDLSAFFAGTILTEADDYWEYKGPLHSGKTSDLITKIQEHGSLRLSMMNQWQANKANPSVAIRIHKIDPLFEDSLDTMDELTASNINFQKYELDIVYSGIPMSNRLISTVDLTARRWFQNTYGLRAHYMQTLNARASEKINSIELAAQYKFPLNKSKYGQSIIPSIHYKRIDAATVAGEFIGGGVSYTDDMWPIVTNFFDLFPFLRYPKTVEVNFEYLPLSMTKDTSNVQAIVLSLKGYLNISKDFAVLGAIYRHSFKFSQNEYSGSSVTAVNDLQSEMSAVQLGVTFRF